MTPGLQAKVQAARRIEQTLTVSAAGTDKLALGAWQEVCSHPDFRELEKGDQAAGLSQLAHHYHAVGAARRDLRATDDALKVLEQAGKLVSDDPDQVLDNRLELIPVLISRFQLSDDRRYLDRALQLGERCLAHLDTASPTAITCRPVVANALWYAYEEGHRPEDLDGCIAWLLPTVPAGRFDLWHARHAVASVVRALVERAATGDRAADLEQAVVLGRRIVTEVPEEGPSSEHIAVLVFASLRRFAVTGDRSDLRDAIGWTRRAVAASGPGGIGVRAQATLVRLLLLWWRDSGDQQALEEAVGLQSSMGVASEPSPPADRNPFNAVIADAMIGLPPLTELLREALDLPQLRPEPRAVLQCQLAVELRSRFGQTDDDADLDQAVEAAEHAVASARAVSPALEARARLELGECLRARFHGSLSRGHGIVFGPSEDLRGAFAAYRAACEAAEADSPVIVLRTARQWAPWAADYGEVSEAALAYSHGLRAFHQLLQRPSNAQQRVAILFEGLGLSTRAAYALAAVGYLTGALLALEAGRAVVTFQQRLGELGAAGQQAWAATDLAVQRYQRAVDSRRTSDDEELRRQVEALAEAMLDPAEGSTVPDAPMTEVPSETDRWYGPIARLQAAVTSTSRVLVYLVASGKGGMCLMVRGDSLDVRWLPQCTEHSIHRQVVQLYRAYRLRHTDKHHQQRFREALNEIGRWLWVAVVGELLEACSGVDCLVVVPTGLLSLLPLNAAWRPDATQPSGRRYAVDQIEWGDGAERSRVARRHGSCGGPAIPFGGCRGQPGADHLSVLGLLRGRGPSSRPGAARSRSPVGNGGNRRCYRSRAHGQEPRALLVPRCRRSAGYRADRDRAQWQCTAPCR